MRIILLSLSFLIAFSAAASRVNLVAPSGGPPPFTPTDLPNLVLWLDASDNATIHFSSGANVNKWDDKSGNANNATAAGGQEPVYDATGLSGGYPALTQSGTPQKMTLTSALAASGGTVLSGCFVGQEVNHTVSQVFIGEIFFINSTDINVYDGHGNEADFSGTVTDNTKFLFCVIANADVTHTTVYKNGTSLTATTHTGSTYNWDLVDAIGSRRGTGFYVNGAYSEYVFSGAAWSPTDLSNITTYLKTKYGIP